MTNGAIITKEAQSLIALIDRAKAEIAKASTIDEARKGAATAEGYLEAWKSIGASEEAIRKATEVLIRWKIRVWQMVEEMRERGALANRAGKPTNSNGVENTPLVLADLGIDKNEAKELRLLSSIPEECLETIFEEHDEDHKPLSVGAVVAEARRMRNADEDEPETPRYPDSDLFMEWLESVRRKSDGILQQFGSLEKLLKSPGWDHNQDGLIHPILSGLSRTLRNFNKELAEWRRRNGKKISSRS